MKIELIKSIIVLLYIGMILLFVLATIFMYINHKHSKKLEEIAMFQISANCNIDYNTIPEILTLIINESFDDYKVMELEKDNTWINPDKENEIRRALTDIVSCRISKPVLDRLSLFYNTENIAKILADKIYIIVMNYVLIHNEKLKNPDNNIKKITEEVLT